MIDRLQEGSTTRRLSAEKGYPFALLVICFAIIYHLYVVQRHMFYGCKGDSFCIPWWLHKQ